MITFKYKESPIALTLLEKKLTTDHNYFIYNLIKQVAHIRLGSSIWLENQNIMFSLDIIVDTYQNLTIHLPKSNSIEITFDEPNTAKNIKVKGHKNNIHSIKTYITNPKLLPISTFVGLHIEKYNSLENISAKTKYDFSDYEIMHIAGSSAR